MLVSFRQISLILPSIRYYIVNHLERVGVGKKRELRKQVEFLQSHLKTVGENVGKWEGVSAKMWESFAFLI